MDDLSGLKLPPRLIDIQRETESIGFSMASDLRTGALLRTLAASKPGGSFLELGTGTGIGTSWILDGMDRSSTLISVDNDDRVVSIARRFLGFDARVRFHISDGVQFLESISEERFDFIFADTWAGKFDQLDLALSLLKPGGLYIIDDLLPLPSWPEEHGPNVESLIESLELKEDLMITKLNWSTGLVVATKRSL